MIGRSALTRGARLALRRQDCAKLAQRRGYAAAASTESASYESTDINGIKVASRDPRSPTARLAIVAKAGTRYQPLPGLSNTDKRSALRITREAELLGGQLKAYHTREALVVEAAFLRDDLPYFTELLGEVITKTRYTTHEFHEEIETILHMKQAKQGHNALAQAVDSAHAVAFHKGLGSSIYPSTSTPLGPYLSENSVAAFAQAVYTKPNIAIVADGTTQANLSKWVEPFFKDVPASSSSDLQLFTEGSKYYGGEQRTSLAGSNAVVIAFPGSNLQADKADVAILSALLGGESSIKWSPGFSLLSKASAAAQGSTIVAKNLAYTDAGLLTIQVTGSARAVRNGAQEAVKALKSVAESGVTKEILTKAIAKAKFDLLTANELTGAGLVSAGNSLIHGGKIFQVTDTLKSYEAVTADKVKAAAKALLDGRATVASVGDLFVLPYAEEIGLKI
ncbi:Cytochrome b-c1 complex subunit 2, mitochondrial [Cytospora mali]|uniref:Cytochrome b-c1 complex subunit 2, mitochondrial n=1 Tax=Cytospora mali TaxID=578113 RepID=A0A194V226_CYTMA|nr:Cytochrome b-c1 complex subunit 2, mitochondrial [Valsa mali var. pyri (nom. inval.)]